MKWELEAARWVLQELAPEDLPALAVQALQEGQDTESMVILAGLYRPTTPDVGPVFEAVLHDLKVNLPSRQEAAWVLAVEASRRIVNGTLAPGQGARRLVRLGREIEPLPEELAVFVGLDSELEDFADGTRLAYYGETHCKKVPGQLERAITEAAVRLAAGEGAG